MKKREQNRWCSYCNSEGTAISRRAVVESCGLGILGLLSGSVFGQEGQGQPRRTPTPQNAREQMEQSQAFFERLRNAGTMEERMKIMEERRNSERAKAVEEFKDQLGVSDQEWAVIKPRIETVYDLAHPRSQSGRSSSQPATPVEQAKSELRQLLGDKDAPPDQIKTALTALRSAKEKARQDLSKARQDLRQVMTLRQEAVLVLSELLD